MEIAAYGFKYGLMNSRCSELAGAINGLKYSGKPLIGYTPAFGVFTAGQTDDRGIYYFIPKLASLFNLSLEQAIIASVLMVFVMAFVLAGTGFSLFFRERKVTLLFLLLGVPLGRVFFREIGDVYVIPALLALAIMPLAMNFFYQKQAPRFAVIGLLLVGIVCGYCHTIRAMSSAGVIAFIAVLIVGNQQLWHKTKLKLLGAMCVGVLVALTHFNHVIKDSYQYLSLQNKRFDSSVIINRHPLWHSVYIGLGYYPNPFGLRYSDTVGFEKVHSTDPTIGYLSPQYDQVLKNETIGFVLSHKLITAKMVFKKALETLGSVCIEKKAKPLGGVAWVFYQFGLIYLLCSLFYFREHLLLHAAFIVSAGMGAVPGVLVVPAYEYVTGFLGVMLLYVVTFLVFAIQNDEIRQWLNQLKTKCT